MESSAHCSFAADTDDDGDADGPIQSALSNPLILSQIFACLPNRHLLMTCSLVNKFWHRQARTFVRDHRKSWLLIESRPEQGTESACEACITLRAISTAFSATEVITFTGLFFRLRNQWQDPTEEKIRCKRGKLRGCENIFKIKLRGCGIEIGGLRVYCAAYKMLLDLLRRNSENLEIIQLVAISPGFVSVLQDWEPRLPKLQTLAICGNIDLNCKDFIEKIIRSAPKLRTIDLGESSRGLRLQVLPEAAALYKLLNNFTVRMDTADQERRCLKVGAAGPALRTLSGRYFTEKHHLYVRSYSTVLHQLICSSRNSLEEIDFNFQSKLTRFLTSFDWPTMSKLELIHFRTCGDSNCRVLVNIISRSLDYNRKFPALTRVHLRATTTVEGGGDNDINEDNENNQQINLLPTANKCVTVSKLELNIKLEEQSLVQIATTFPAVVHLCLGHIHPESPPPFSQIFRLWPQLEDLEIKGTSLHLCPNCDAEFCGISREEMDTYYGKDEEFLAALQIVPVSPCIATLTRLRSLSMDRFLPRGIATVDELANPREAFLSKPTDVLVFKRLSLGKVNIQFGGSEDSEDEASEVSDNGTDDGDSGSSTSDGEED